MVESNEIISKASKGYIEKYYNTSTSIGKNGKFEVFPEFNRDKALDAIRKDSTVISAITTLVDKSVNKGWKTGNKITDKTLTKLRFNKLLRKIFYNIYGYGNVFIENVKNGNSKVKELHVLETTITEPVTDNHGKVSSYIQNVPSNGGANPVTWSVEEVTHIASTTLTTGIWGELDIQSIYTLVLIKQYIKEYLGWVFGTNQFRPFYNIRNANVEQVKSFLSYLRKSEKDITFPLIAEGEIEAKVLRDFSDGTTILEIWEKCDRDIMTLFQTSPINMGQPGDSNRSSSDGQGKADDVHIRSIQKLVADEINFDLFPKIGLKDDGFEFLEIDDKKIEKLLEMSERMVNMGFKTSVVEKYLRENDFPITGKLFDEERMLEGKKSEDMYASRSRKDGESNDKIGTGDEGTTRKNQLGGQ